jgi:hypothetical protein
VVRNREHGARVALAQLPSLDHLQNVFGQLQQPHPVRNNRFRPADALGELPEREPELVEDDRERTCFVDGREILAGDILDQSEQERFTVVGVTHNRGNRLQLRVARRPPAAFARDQLVATGDTRSNEHRLHDPLCPHRVGKPGDCLGVEASSRLPWIRMDRVDRELRQLRRAASAEQDLETSAEPSPLRNARQAPSPPSSTRPRP